MIKFIKNKKAFEMTLVWWIILILFLIIAIMLYMGWGNSITKIFEDFNPFS